jgi:hypothetical protein
MTVSGHEQALMYALPGYKIGESYMTINRVQETISKVQETINKTSLTPSLVLK